MGDLVDRPYTEKDLQQTIAWVRILTNSLASNDVITAHAGHAEYREEILATGAEDEGVEVRYDKEPETTFGQRLQSGFIEILPVQSQL